MNTCTSYRTWPQGRVANNSTTLTCTPRCQTRLQEILVLAFNGELIIIQSFSLTIEQYPPLKCLRVADSEMFYTHCPMPCSLSKESSFDYFFLLDIICLVGRDRVFLESLNASAGTGTCALTCTLGRLQSVFIFSTLVQTCTACCALGGTSNFGGIHGCHRLNVRGAHWAPHSWGASRMCHLFYGVFSERRPLQNQWWFRIWRHNRQSERVWDGIFCTAACSFVHFL